METLTGAPLVRHLPDAILYLGLDVATKRDTCALVAVSPDDAFETYFEYGHRIWIPPVDLVRQVEPVLDWIFTNLPVAGMWYDPYQAVTLVQRLEAKGHRHKLIEVNQQTQMTKAVNTLQSLLTENRLALIDDPATKAQFSWVAAKNTERGLRIIKTAQTKKIDYVAALAMAVLGAAEEGGLGTYPAWSSTTHLRSPFVFELEAA